VTFHCFRFRVSKFEILHPGILLFIIELSGGRVRKSNRNSPYLKIKIITGFHFFPRKLDAIFPAVFKILAIFRIIIFFWFNF